MTQNGKYHHSLHFLAHQDIDGHDLGPYLFTIIVNTLISGYMLFRPSNWVSEVMQLTYMSDVFRCWLLALAFGIFVLSWTAEKNIFPRVAQMLGHARARLQPNYRKKRKMYKVLLEALRL